MSTTTETGRTPVTPEIAQTITAVLERGMLERLTSIMDDRSQVLEDVQEIAAMARVLLSSTGFEGFPPIGGIQPLGAEALEVVIRAARWEDELAEDCLLNQWSGDEPGYRPEYDESYRRRAEAARAVLAYLGAIPRLISAPLI